MRTKTSDGSRTSQLPAKFPECKSLTVLVDRLTCDDPGIRRGALRNLALICHQRRSQDGATAAHLLLLIEHTAKWSDDKILQRESIDLLELLRETQRLRSLTFEIGSQDAREHRNAALLRLKIH